MTDTDLSAVDPQRVALLVMDYQTGLLQRMPDASTLLRRANGAVDYVRAHGAHVGWVRVGFDDELDAIPPHSVMARSATSERRGSLHADAPATQIHDDLSPQPADIAVRKTRVGAFTTTDLGDRLREREITTLLLAGISTSGVVLSTVREAMDRDYRIVVLADACADPDLATHEFLIGTIFPRHATVAGVDDLSELRI